MNIQPIVEGDGEVTALPVLLRRLIAASGAYQLDVNQPIRRSRTELVREDGVRKAVRLARLRPDCAAILIVFDGDDDCPKDIAPRVEAWGQAEAAPLLLFCRHCRIANTRRGSWQRSSHFVEPGAYGVMRPRIPTPNRLAARPRSYEDG